MGVEDTVILGSPERHCTGQSEGANMDSQVDNHKNVCAVCKQGGKSLWVISYVFAVRLFFIG